MREDQKADTSRMIKEKMNKNKGHFIGLIFLFGPGF